MGKELDFQESLLKVKFTGLTSIAALKQEIDVPYKTIQKVSIGHFDISPLSFRVGTSWFGKDLKEGRFLVGGDWIFLSFHHHDRVLIMELEGHEYKKIVLEIEDLEAAKEEILKRRGENKD